MRRFLRFINLIKQKQLCKTNHIKSKESYRASRNLLRYEKKSLAIQMRKTFSLALCYIIKIKIRKAIIFHRDYGKTQLTQFSYQLPMIQSDNCFLYPSIFVIPHLPQSEYTNFYPTPIQNMFFDQRIQEEQPYRAIAQQNFEKKNKVTTFESFSSSAKMQQEFSDKKQVIILENRNLLPNITNVILSYIRRPNKSRKIVQRFMRQIASQDVQHNIRRFYAYQHYIKNNVTDFISRRAIHSLMQYENPKSGLFSLEEQRLYNRIFRRLAKYYLENHYLLFITGSDKIKGAKRIDHLKVYRYLLSVLKSPTSSR